MVAAVFIVVGRKTKGDDRRSLRLFPEMNGMLFLAEEGFQLEKRKAKRQTGFICAGSKSKECNVPMQFWG